MSTAVSCTAIGDQAGLNITTGSHNTLYGALAGDSLTTGISNTYIGSGAGKSTTTADYRTAVGFEAGQKLGVNGVAVGALAGAYQQGQDNVFLGNAAGFGSSTYNGPQFSTSCVAVGFQAGEDLTSGGITHLWGIKLVMT